MKLKSTLSMLALLSTLHVSAQSDFGAKKFSFTKKQQRGAATGSSNTSNKSTATMSRLIAVTSLEYMQDSSGFVIIDTAHVSYSGNRGGDLESEYIKFDEGTGWNDDGSGLELSSHFTQTFDGNDNILTSLSEMWNGSAWENDWGSLFTYDVNNNMIMDIELTGTGSTWDSAYKYTYTYDANNHMTTEMGQMWNGTAWVNEYSYEYDLDANGNTIVSTFSEWNGTAWDSTGKIWNTYNVNNLVTEMISQNWDGSAWVNGTRMLTTYDANGVVLTTTYENWNTMAGAWVSMNMETNTITNGDIVNSLTQMWNGSTWQSIFNITRSFDANHNNILEVNQTWNGAAFEDESKVDRTYNSFNQVTSEKDATWNGSSWINVDSDSWGRYYYEDYTASAGNVAATEKSFSLYPVPAHNFITVEKVWDAQQPFTVSIIDMQGRQVATYSEKATANYKRTIDVNQLPSGSYIVKITAKGGKASYQQFVIAK